jgi:hypothetical protein
MFVKIRVETRSLVNSVGEGKSTKQNCQGQAKAVHNCYSCGMAHRKVFLRLVLMSARPKAHSICSIGRLQRLACSAHTNKKTMVNKVNRGILSSMPRLKARRRLLKG